MDSRVVRRHFLKLLTLGVAGLHAKEIDVDQLLWVPGQKKIFLPPSPVKTGLSYNQITALELERIARHIKSLFERDDTFYTQITRKQ